jgi:hypothetical protein
MTNPPPPEEVAAWQRRLASQANNRAWELAELAERTPEDSEEMLQAAHAAMYFWKIVGTANNRAHAAQLVAHVYALLASPDPAKHYLAQSQPHFLGQPCDAWEKRSRTLSLRMSPQLQGIAKHMRATTMPPKAWLRHCLTKRIGRSLTQRCE